MIQNILRHLGGIANYGTLSLCMFSFIFLCVFIWACLQRKAHLEHMARVPLETEEELKDGDSHHE